MIILKIEYTIYHSLIEFALFIKFIVSHKRRRIGRVFTWLFFSLFLGVQSEVGPTSYETLCIHSSFMLVLGYSSPSSRLPRFILFHVLSFSLLVSCRVLLPRCPFSTRVQHHLVEFLLFNRISRSLEYRKHRLLPTGLWPSPFVISRVSKDSTDCRISRWIFVGRRC